MKEFIQVINFIVFQLDKSYGRVSNKNFIENLAREYHLDLSDKQGLKYPANFDVVHQILTVNL